MDQPRKKCPDGISKEKLVRFVFHELDDKDNELVAKHASQCPWCKQTLLMVATVMGKGWLVEERLKSNNTGLRMPDQIRSPNDSEY